jgi:hypothetical protein
MWNDTLIALAGAYSTGVLTVVEPPGYPMSVRCALQCDATRQVVTFPALPPLAADWRGKAALLFHRHNAVLEEQHELLIKGELVEEGGQIVFHPTGFVTGTGHPTKDSMPHASDPVQVVQFMLLGRRKAREYLAKRGTPWEPIRFDLLLQLLKERGLTR